MNTDSDEGPGLARIYDGAQELFLRGEHSRAVERFISIYEVDCTFRDVAEIVNDYYDKAKGEWIARYTARFGQHDERR